METIERRVARETKRVTRRTIIKNAVDGVLTNAQAAQVLGLTVRQIKRLKKGYRDSGPSALADGRSARARSPRKSLSTVRKICILKETVYADFSVKHFYEYLTEEHGVADVSYSYVLRLLQRHGLVDKTKRRGTYRRRRERQPMVGMRLHLDSSTHRWLGEERPEWDLTVALDDADGRILSAHFAPEEGTVTSLQALFEVLTCYGRFCELYTDRGSHFCQTSDQQRGPDDEQKTQVARVLKALSIRAIWARSPQARGRSERVFRTLQDRLVNELKLAGITNYDDANDYLNNVFIPKFNRRFTVKPKLEDSAFTALPLLDLHLLLSVQHTRVVRNDFCVHFENRPLQLPSSVSTSLPGCKVVVHTFLDGSLGVSYKGKLIATFTADGQPVRLPETLSPTSDANQPRPTLPEPNRRPPSPSELDLCRFFKHRQAGAKRSSPVISGHDLFLPAWGGEGGHL